MDFLTSPLILGLNCAPYQSNDWQDTTAITIFL